MATALAATPALLFCATGQRPCALCLIDRIAEDRACAHPAMGVLPVSAPLPDTCPLTLPREPHQGRA